jgi:23S rRNA pseudouridine955/2504/2580 synthase
MTITSSQEAANTYNKVSFLTVTEYSGAGQRIDNYLVKQLKNIPKSKIYNILRKGEVRVNKGRIKPSYKLQADDVVRVPPLTNVQTSHVPIISDSAVQHFNIAEAVIYEDQNLLIINKPAGLAVHGGSGLSFGLIELLRKLRPTEKSLELVHRIDRDTSGCVMVARNTTMLRAMHELFKTNKINKIYHAIVKGYASDNFVVNEPLKKFVLSSGERLVRANPEGQSALTKFSVIERYDGMTLLQASPVTGRTHQIRVHAALRGLPIVGDQKYGDKQHDQIMRKLGHKRLFLHAYQLQFTCPLSGEKIHVQAEYGDDWNIG